MKIRTARAFLTAGTGLACLAWYLVLLAMVCAPRVLNSSPVQASILKALSRNLPESVTISNFQLSMRPWPSLEVRAVDLSLGPVEAHIPRLTVSPRLVPLLWGEIEVAGVHLFDPRLKLNPVRRNEAAKTNRGLPGGVLSQLPDSMDITIHQGNLELLAPGVRTIAVSDLQAEIDLGPSARITASCSSALWQDLVIELQADLQTLSATGRFALQQLRPDQVVARLTSTPAWTPGRSGIDLEGAFSFEDLDHARLDLHGSTDELVLARQDRRLVLSRPGLAMRVDVAPREVTLQVDSLSLDDPGTAVSGQARFDRTTKRSTFVVHGDRLDLTGLRQRVLTLFAGVKPVREVLDIVRGGEISDLRLSSSGHSLEEIARGLKMDALLQEGQVLVPDPKLDLTRIRGHLSIDNRVLRGRGLSARLHESTAWNGTLSLAMNEQVRPFSLSTEVSGPAGQLPPILRQSVESRAFLRELARVSDVQGTLTGTLGLNRDEDHDMEVHVQARDLNLRARYEPLPHVLQASGGRFEYTDSALSGQDIELRFGQSRIQDLSFELALKPSLDLDYDVQGADLKWRELFPWLAGSTFCRTRLPGLDTVNGSVQVGTMTFSGPPTNLDQCSYQAQGSLEGLVLHQKDLPGPLHLESGTFDLQPGQLQMETCRIRFLDGQGRLNGRVSTRSGSAPEFDLSFEGSLGSRAGEWVMTKAELPPELKLQSPVQVSEARVRRTAGVFDCALQALVNGRVQLDLNLTRSPDALDISRLHIHDQASQARMALTVSETSSRISFAGELVKATLDRLLQENHTVQGGIQGDFQAVIDLRPFQILSAAGSTRISDLLLPIPGSDDLKAVHLKLQAKNSEMRLEKGLFELGRDQLGLTGSVDLKETANVMDLDLTAQQLHWDSLNRILSPLETGTGKAPPEDGPGMALSGELRVRAECFDFHGLPWCPLQAGVHLSPSQTIRVQVSDSRLCSIETPGSIVLQPETSQAQFYPSVRGSDLNAALTCLFGKEELMTGRFDLSGQLSSKGSMAIETWQGSLNFLAREGRIRRFNLLGKILGFLNSTEILFGNFPDLDQEGLGYHELSIRSRVEEGRLILDQGRLNGESMEMGFQGQVDLQSREVNLDVLVAPLKTVDRLFKKIPVISGLMGGNLISIPVKVTGTLSDPKVRPLSPESVSNELKNMMSRALELPMKIFAPFFPDRE